MKKLKRDIAATFGRNQNAFYFPKKTTGEESELSSPADYNYVLRCLISIPKNPRHHNTDTGQSNFF